MATNLLIGGLGVVYKNRKKKSFDGKLVCVIDRQRYYKKSRLKVNPGWNVLRKGFRGIEVEVDRGS